MAAAVAQIYDISAPNVRAGDYASVDVYIKNIILNVIYLKVTGIYNSSLLAWEPIEALFDPSEIRLFHGSFVMPSKSVKVVITSWYWAAETSIYLQDETTEFDMAPLGFSEFGIASFSKV